MIRRRSDESLNVLIKESHALKDQLLEATAAIHDFAAKLQEEVDRLEADANRSKEGGRRDER